MIDTISAGAGAGTKASDEKGISIGVIGPKELVKRILKVMVPNIVTMSRLHTWTIK